MLKDLEIREIKGYEGRYSVTDDGRIYSHIRNKFLSPSRRTDGYQLVHLSSRDNKRKDEYAHRLVAFAFLSDTYFTGAVVNHKDGNPENNIVENLEWVTQSYNCKHAVNIGRIKTGEKSHRYGKTLSDESRKKLSASIKAWYANKKTKAA